jgi:hypothetical protein
MQDLCTGTVRREKGVDGNQVMNVQILELCNAQNLDIQFNYTIKA